MSVPVKLAGFAAVLALLFAGGAVAGDAIDPKGQDAAASESAGAHGGDGAEEAAAHDDAAPAHGAEASAHGSDKAGAHPVRGLAIADGGLRVVLADPELRRGRTERVAFRVVDDGGKTVRDFDVEHEKRMHLIIARRDLTGFQHLHPRQAADGTWTAPVRLDEAGSYRLFADFSHEDTPRTLATDLRVDGVADFKPLPAPRPSAPSDGGYDVQLDSGRAAAGREAELRFTVTKDGHTVHTEPYLGAGGHLVALREGDLAFLHVHPTEDDHGDETSAADGHDDSIGFAATFPTAGRYRLFLQFKHEGRVQTVAFTQEVSR